MVHNHSPNYERWLDAVRCHVPRFVATLFPFRTYTDTNVELLYIYVSCIGDEGRSNCEVQHGLIHYELNI